MSARELLEELTNAGLRIEAAGDRLLVRPSSKLTDDMRSALRAEKPAMLALLSAPAPEPTPRPYRLSAADGDAAHFDPWDDATIARFVARIALLMRRGVRGSDADDLAERLHLRDLQGDGRVCCGECRHYRPEQCGNHRRAGLPGAKVAREFVAELRHCPGFDRAVHG